MSKRKCYFQCIYEGQLYGFPPPSYTNYEKFCKWKKILRKSDQEKDNLYIAHSVKLCGNHFEKHYIAANNRLTRHAVPTLNLGITMEQEELLCTFVEENAKLIMQDNLNSEMLVLLRAKWKVIGPKLNELGPKKTYSGWAEYVYDIMANLKTKEVLWTKDDDDMWLVKNADDFTELELKILHLWHRGTEEPELFESNLDDENDIEMDHELDDDAESNADNTISRVAEVTVRGKDIITYTLNVEVRGDTPLLQAANIAPCKDPQNNSNVNCKCKQSDGEVHDEYEAFGEEIAEQLRHMPAEAAAKTQKQIRALLRNQQKRILNDSFLNY